MKSILYISVVIILPISGWAQPMSYLPGIGDGTHRERVNPHSPPWNLLGRVQTELGVRCTGFAVAPTVIMTAAHCLWLPATRRYIQPHDVHVLMGYEFGNYRIHERVRQFIIPADYNPRSDITEKDDRATLILDHPVVASRDIAPIVSGRIGSDVRLVGYSQDRIEVPIGDLHCHINAISNNGLIHHDCEATHGVSGAPLFSRDQNGLWGISGIAVQADVGAGGVAIPLR